MEGVMSAMGFLERFRNVPVNAVIELTYRCNFKCSHCYIQKGDGNKKSELTFDEWVVVLGKIKKIGVLFLTFTGGEVFTRKDFIQLLIYASRIGFAIRVFTNGSFIDRRIAKKLSSLNILEIEMSIYGSEGKLNDRITRVPGSFENICSATQILVENNIKVNLKTPVMRDNISQLEEIHSFATSLGALHFFDMRITPCDDGDISPLTHRLNFEDISAVYKRIKRMRSSLMENDIKRKAVIEKDIVCNAGRNGFCISPDGGINPCVQIREKIGNALNDDLTYIWETSELLLFLRSLKRTALKGCSGCNYINTCPICPGLNYLENRDYLMVDKFTCHLGRGMNR